MEKLDEKIYIELTALSEQGNQLAKERRYEDAKAKFLDALRLIPEPHTKWNAATWLYTAVGDMHFHLGNFEKTRRCFSNAVQCPGGLGNSYVHLRLGQANLELGADDTAADELTRAYMGAGLKIFMEDDPKYVEFLEKRIKL
ncbi:MULTISPECIES: hypothetical protein [Janthinobacterium]|uniref:hypothetical protein n=1 Tax=Janthinobacterium TaxID=29580 RepID=UPI00159592F3|nr:hypothetical protein [Janthinobacterium sp. BJB401]NVI83872.1 hypothetical protein [Janthinobacterium sp. BJB401]